MKTIQRDTNQYFIIDGVNVYASLLPTLEQNHHVLFLKTGKEGLDAVLNSTSPEIVFVFDFLNKLSETPMTRLPKSIMEHKFDCYDAVSSYTQILANHFRQCVTDRPDVAKEAAFEAVGNFTFTHPNGVFKFEIRLKNAVFRKTDIDHYISFSFELWVNDGIKREFTRNITFHQCYDLDKIIGDICWQIMTGMPVKKEKDEPVVSIS